ncbi:DUF2924 domain-containing protein [Polymorphobacter sp.]|uniref:DUF2924 domain-containing protein n=1 Tax=Polymorphobacter sp. TaxID=1909290 RepID=UPI003F727F2D
MTVLTEQLAALPAMSPAQLRAEWRRVYRTAPPRLTPDLLVRGIAYRLQERSQGGLPAGTARELDRAAQRLLRGDSLGPRGDTRLKPGTRLVRHWNGTTYNVLVSENGFIMDGRSFTSLSHVAKAITGAHWSGPRFVGVKLSVGGQVGAAAMSSARRVSAVRAAAS